MRRSGQPARCWVPDHLAGVAEEARETTAHRLIIAIAAKDEAQSGTATPILIVAARPLRVPTPHLTSRHDHSSTGHSNRAAVTTSQR